MKKDNKQEPALRAAIYRVHNEKDVYTHQPLSFEDMEIDHIIPISFKQTPDLLTKLLEEIGLSTDFELDNIENYLPIHKQTNRQKSDLTFSPHIARYYLELAKTAAPKIREAIADYKLKKKLDSSIENLKSSIFHGNHDPEKLYNVLSDDDEDFLEQRFTYQDGPHYVYSYSKKNVKIDADLPLYRRSKWEGNCILTFRSLKIRDSTLTLNHHDLVTYLFEGLFTDPDLQQRGFLAGKHPKHDFYFVQIGNSRFPLRRSVLDQLCEIIDDFAVEYIKAFEDLESLIQATGFTRSTTSHQGYRLIKVNLNLWRALIEFAILHDFEDGDTPWHMFDRNNFMIKVYSPSNGVRYEEGYHVFLNGELSGEPLFLEPVDDLWIIWEPVVDLDSEGEIKETVNVRQTWSVFTTYNWLLNEFIPSVLAHQGDISEISEPILNHGYVRPIQVEEITTISELKNLIDTLQRFFYQPRTFLLEREELASLYLVLMICLRRTEIEDLDYVTRRASIRETVTNLEGLLEGINRKRQNIEERELINYHMVDNLLRAISVCFRNYPKLDIVEIQEVKGCLRPFFYKMKQMATIEKMLKIYSD